MKSAVTQFTDAPLEHYNLAIPSLACNLRVDATQLSAWEISAAIP